MNHLLKMLDLTKEEIIDILNLADQLKYENKIKCADGKYRSEIYICRGEDKGKKLDRRAIGIISIALGHNREDTAISNYVRNL